MSNTEALRQALHEISLCAQNSASSKEECGRIARAALAQPAASGEPDMRHPKIQALISGIARREIELRLVEQLLDDPNCDLSTMDMEYWHGLHDKLRERLAPYTIPDATAQPAPARVPLTDERLNAAGLDYALADSFSSSKAEWVAQDIADAFKAGARAAERHHGITAPGAPDTQPTRAEGE